MPSLRLTLGAMDIKKKLVLYDFDGVFVDTRNLNFNLRKNTNPISPTKNTSGISKVIFLKSVSI
jgi:hypothetical protein